MKKKQTAIVILPTYNERENVAITIPALQEVFKTISDWKMEILVVDDTSPDKTYEVVEKLQQQHKNLHLLLNKQKSGLGGAYLKGMKHAFDELGADVVFEFDADLSHDQHKIPEFLQRIDAGADMVLGNRYIEGGSIPEDWGAHRKFLSIAANLFIMVVMTDFRIRDWTSGFRALKKPVFNSIKNKLDSKQFSGYTFQIGSLYYALRSGFNIDPNVAYHFTDRTIGQSKIGPEYIKNTLLFIFEIRLKELLRNRLVKFAVVGGLGAVVQLVTLSLFWNAMGMLYELAYFLSTEAAVASNFALSNIWTFSDKKLSWPQIPAKFIGFNLASAGSIILQLIIASLGSKFIGLFALFTLPIVGFEVTMGHVYAIVGILVGMCWNFFAYTRFIWKTHTK